MPRSKSAGNADSKPGDPNQSESLCRETMNDVPAGFLPLSSAINPSQKSKEKKNGRRTRQTEALGNAVLALVNYLKWNGKDGITTLHRLLVASGRPDVPSQDTVARLVDQLHRETGDMKLLRVTRVPASRPS